MKITASEIVFTHLRELASFMEDLGLVGHLRLNEPVTDKSGAVLIKEHIAVKPSVLEKLEEMEGQYEPLFKVELNRDVMKSMNAFLTKAVISRLNKSENDFLLHLFESNRHNYRAYIRHSFIHKSFSLLFYRMHCEKYEFFNHQADLGLTALGLLILRSPRHRMIHRYTFLTGFCADLALSEENDWKAYTRDGTNGREVVDRCADFLKRLPLPDGVAQAVRDHYFDENAAPKQGQSNDLYASFFDESAEIEQEANTDSDSNEQSDADGESAQDAASEPEASPEPMEVEVRALITEIMRMARFLQRTGYRLQGTGNRAGKLVEMFAYNAARGFFTSELLEPILKIFEQYAEQARRLMIIAETENKCIHPPSAWAYPKPNAAQILCKDSKQDCRKIVMGWDIHITMAQEAYGWIGTTLPPGSYQKCTLEDDIREALEENRKNNERLALEKAEAKKKAHAEEESNADSAEDAAPT